ncbi:hypothetical protein RFM67_33550, partial [Mesorhizobium sp. VK2D]|nr:hypothetical protein [Mesorhizobium sp. VK2D]
MGRVFWLVFLNLSCLGILLNLPPTDPRGSTLAASAAPIQPPATSPDEASKAPAAVGSAKEDVMPLRVLGTEMMNQVTGKNSRNDTAARWGVYG